MRRAESLLVGLALALVVIGASLLPLTQPFFTRLLSQRFSLAEEAGLPSERMTDIAEQVRIFVVSPNGTALPAEVEGRPGFDEAAISHLVDVRHVISAAAVFTAVVALLVTAWIVLRVSRHQVDRVAAALRVGAVVCIAFVLLTALAGVFDFDRLFTAFHGLFFAEGTWTFAYDSLLIQTFPEPFWAVAGATWAGLITLGGVLLGWAAHLLKGSAPEVPESAE